MGRIDLAKEKGEENHFEEATAALERMNTLIDDVLRLARGANR